MQKKNSGTTLSLEEAIEIGQAGVKAGKNSQFLLAKMYYAQAADRMIELRTLKFTVDDSNSKIRRSSR
jgi:hypothetical protein